MQVDTDVFAALTDRAAAADRLAAEVATLSGRITALTGRITRLDGRVKGELHGVIHVLGVFLGVEGAGPHEAKHAAPKRDRHLRVLR